MAKQKSNTKKKNSKPKFNIWRILQWGALLFFGSSVLITFIYRFIPPPATPLMLIRVVENISEGNRASIRHNWVSLENISPYLQQAVIASEDSKFTEHHGIDLKAIERAKQLNKKGKKIRGGSTISQQTAKNVFLWPARNYLRKGLELYFTGLIEVLWGKKRIMEVYLNMIEMGDGIYGAEAASQAYFKKPAAQLTENEAAAIAAILPNPRKWQANNPTPYIQKKKSRIKQGINGDEAPEWQ